MIKYTPLENPNTNRYSYETSSICKVVGFVLLLCTSTIALNYFILSPITHQRIQKLLDKSQFVKRQEFNSTLLDILQKTNYSKISADSASKQHDDGKHVIALLLIHHELEVLYIRLTEHWNVVDEFHIFESPLTHQQRPKPFYVKESFHLFQEFHSKITLHQIEYNFDPVKECNQAHKPYKCEAYERDYMIKAVNNNDKLKMYDPKDVVIIISDLDEIASEGLIKNIRNDSVTLPINLGTKLYKHSMHWYCMIWWRPSIMSLEFIQKHDGVAFSNIRRASGSLLYEFHKVEDGWHLSTFGTIEQITQKAKNMAAGDRSHSFDETLKRLYHGNGLYGANPSLYYVSYENGLPEMRIFETNPFFARTFLLQYDKPNF